MRFRPEHQNRGFDDRIFPRVQIIPVGETRTVHYASTFELMPRLSGLSRLSTFPACPTSRSRGGTLVVKGLSSGEDKIVWVRRGDFREGVMGFRTLNCIVLDPLEIIVSCVLVRDAEVDGKSPYETSRKLNQLSAIIQRANEILQPQTNIRLEPRGAHEKTSPRPLGDKVVLFNDDRNNNIKALKTLGNPAADINVYFVWDLVLEQKNHRGDDVGLGRPLQPEVFIDDTAHTTDDAAQTLAHELMHVFQADHMVGEQQLMAETYVGGGTFIPSAMAEHANRIGGIWLRAQRKGA